MEMKTLVAYATKNGSTREIAEAVADALCSQGLEVDLELLRKVKSLKEYAAVVIGAPLYLYRWHSDAMHFLNRHQDALIKRPVAVFGGGPFYQGDQKEWQGAQAQLYKELARFSWFKPVSIEVVGGKYDPQMLCFPLNLFSTLKKMPANDLRDWKAIDAWARSLPQKFKEAGELKGK
jgi:menaquinone-dependent protoporphyrinogen oxidase